MLKNILIIVLSFLFVNLHSYKFFNQINILEALEYSFKNPSSDDDKDFYRLIVLLVTCNSRTREEIEKAVCLTLLEKPFLLSRRIILKQPSGENICLLDNAQGRTVFEEVADNLFEDRHIPGIEAQWGSIDAEYEIMTLEVLISYALDSCEGCAAFRDMITSKAKAERIECRKKQLDLQVEIKRENIVSYLESVQ